jgi:hypothetical protein
MLKAAASPPRPAARRLASLAVLAGHQDKHELVDRRGTEPLGDQLSCRGERAAAG